CADWQCASDRAVEAGLFPERQLVAGRERLRLRHWFRLRNLHEPLTGRPAGPEVSLDVDPVVAIGKPGQVAFAVLDDRQLRPGRHRGHNLVFQARTLPDVEGVRGLDAVTDLQRLAAATAAHAVAFSGLMEPVALDVDVPRQPAIDAPVPKLVRAVVTQRRR